MINMKREKHYVKRLMLLVSLFLIFLQSCASSGREMPEPPQLTLSAGETRVQAIRLTYSWDSRETGVEADAFHPLEIRDQLPVFEVPADGVVNFDFETVPDQITVRAWKMSVTGTDAYDKPDLSLTVTNKNTVTLPSDDRYLYEVHAKWEMRDRTGGAAYYGFASVPGKD